MCWSNNSNLSTLSLLVGMFIYDISGGWRSGWLKKRVVYSLFSSCLCLNDAFDLFVLFKQQLKIMKSTSSPFGSVGGLRLMCWCGLFVVRKCMFNTPHVAANWQLLGNKTWSGETLKTRSAWSVVRRISADAAPVGMRFKSFYRRLDD